MYFRITYVQVSKDDGANELGGHVVSVTYFLVENKSKTQYYYNISKLQRR